MRKSHELEVPNKFCCFGAPVGFNTMEVHLDRNFFVTNDVIKARVKINNTLSLAKCKKVIMKLEKTIELSGSNGRVFRHTEQVCRT